jgi:hypothetical protein
LLWLMIIVLRLNLFNMFLFKLGRLHFYYTNPAKDMLLGLKLENVEFEDENKELLMSMDTFSIGLFLIRIDIPYNEYFNMEVLNNLNNKNEDI